MIRIEDLTPPTNLNPQPILILNRWTCNTDVVFKVITPQGRARIAVPAKSVVFKAIRPRRMRAELVRTVLRGYRKGGALRISRAQIDEAFVQVLRADGCDKYFLAFQRVKLTLGGIVTKLWRYWAVPKPAPETKGVPSDQENSQN